MYKRSKPGRRSEADKQAGNESRLVSFRLFPEDIERLDELVASGYAANRTEVIRRSIAESHKWTT